MKSYRFEKDTYGGGVATIGATRNAYGGSIGNPLDSGGSRIEIDFFESYEPGIKLSQMLTNSQIKYLNNVWKDYITLEEFILLGDPSLMIGGYS